MGRGRGGSRREKISLIYRGRYTYRGDLATSNKEKERSGISKDLGNSMFTYM